MRGFGGLRSKIHGKSCERGRIVMGLAELLNVLLGWGWMSREKRREVGGVDLELASTQRWKAGLAIIGG